MELVQSTQDTIAAIATPPGEGGVAVIRISGPKALEVAAKVYSGPIHTYASHTAHLGKILNSAGDLVDEVLVLVMRAPRSYTGEDTVEVHCHGGYLISKKVLDQILLAGARAAGPGEFTLRAFLNGKIDLAQAEAVQELISAKNELALKTAEQQLQGRLSQAILLFQKELVDSAAILEAWVDFPEEDLEFATMEEFIAQLLAIQRKMRSLSETFHEGKRMSHGISLCLSGLPNAGKSSLMNALLGRERAIVTEIAGTTRDLLEEELYLGQLHFRLTDTAGIRETEEIIEKEGIRRSYLAMRDADLILLVLDASQPLCAETKSLIAAAPEHKRVLIWNKIDLLDENGSLFTEGVPLSAKTGEGLDALKAAIDRMLWKKGAPPSKEEVIITNARHHQALNRAIDALQLLIDHLSTGVSPEFVSQDMRCVLTELGSVIGMDITEDILSAIFSKFCIGK